MEIKNHFTHSFSFTQEDVIAFAKISGDNNPIHLDQAYAATTPFGKTIVHGFLTGSVFSKVFGTIYPGEGTIYILQEMQFKRPVFVNETYTAVFDLLEFRSDKGIFKINCKIVDSQENVCLAGEAKLLNKKYVGLEGSK